MRPETTEDWPQANRRSTTDLTLIRPPSNRPNRQENRHLSLGISLAVDRFSSKESAPVQL